VLSYPSEYVLTWNEPNHAEQTNIDPNSPGIWKMWKDLYVAAKAAGKQIGSPQVAGCGANCSPRGTVGNGLNTWVVPFFQGVCGSNCTAPRFNKTCCPDYFPDFITTHIYYSSLMDAKRRLQEVKDFFPGVKIWITEFGYNQEPVSVEDGISRVMDFVNYLATDDMVFRASWYIYGYGNTPRHNVGTPGSWFFIADIFFIFP
jgi:hypothetical protein